MGVLGAWWRERRKRRDAVSAARESDVRDRAFAIVRGVAEPLVTADRARVGEVSDEHHGANDTWIELTPLVEDAAQVAVKPDAWIVSVCVGPEGSLHEIVVGKNDAWKAALRGCLDAVVGGRYVERIDRGRVGDHLVMTFERADGPDDIVVTHQSLGLQRGAYGPYGERRFAAYDEVDDRPAPDS